MNVGEYGYPILLSTGDVSCLPCSSTVTVDNYALPCRLSDNSLKLMRAYARSTDSKIFVRQLGNPPSSGNVNGVLTKVEGGNEWAGSTGGFWGDDYEAGLEYARVYFDDAEGKWRLVIWDDFWWTDDPEVNPYPIVAKLPRIYDGAYFDVNVYLYLPQDTVEVLLSTGDRALVQTQPDV